MKRLLLALVVLLVVALLGAGAYGAHLLRRLNTPEFQKGLLRQAREAVGADVRVKEMDISLLSGVALKGIAVANPVPFSGDLLTAEQFVLRYRLRPLLSRRLEVDRVALEDPRLALLVNARGVFNYERLGSGARAPASAGAAVPLRVVLKQLSVSNGTVTLSDHTNARLLTVEDADFTSAFDIEGGIARGSGQAAVESVSLGDLVFLRSVKAPLTLSKDTVTLAPIRADVARGSATGDVTVHMKGGFRYVARLDVKGVDARTLLEEAKSAAGLRGTLSGNATFEGSGGVATIRGRGQGTVSDCRLENARALALLASVLQVPELASPDFDDCRAEFTQSGYRLSTPVLLLSGKAVQLSGAGAVDLRSYGLDYQMNLALAPRLFAKVTRPELRPAFTRRPDGFSTIDFRLYGTTTAPQTDILARIARGAATDALKKGLQRLFRK